MTSHPCCPANPSLLPLRACFPSFLACDTLQLNNRRRERRLSMPIRRLRGRNPVFSQPPILLDHPWRHQRAAAMPPIHSMPAAADLQWLSHSTIRPSGVVSVGSQGLSTVTTPLPPHTCFPCTQWTICSAIISVPHQDDYSARLRPGGSMCTTPRITMLHAWPQARFPIHAPKGWLGGAFTYRGMCSRVPGCCLPTPCRRGMTPARLHN